MNKVFNTTKSPGRWKEEIKERARKEDDRLSGNSIDYFVFRRGRYDDNLPDQVIGRVYLGPVAPLHN